MIPITIYARLDAYTDIMVSDRDSIEWEVQKWTDALEEAARVADPRASICEDTAHVEIHPGSDHTSRGESIFVHLESKLSRDPSHYHEEPLTALTLQHCMEEELHCLKCFSDGRCKICGFTPNAGAAFGTNADFERDKPG